MNNSTSSHSTQKLKILQAVLGGHRKTSKDEYYFKCPSCCHHKHKLAVNLSKNMFHCWICDYKGRSIRRLVRRFGNLKHLQSWERIVGRIDLRDFADLFVEDNTKEPPQKLELPKEFISLTSQKPPRTSAYAMRYLRDRGVSYADIVRWKIGYCFDGQYRGRVVVPSFDDDGDANYFIARTYNGDSYRYKNPKASKDVVFNELFVDWNDDLVIVEGVFDAIRAGNAVPILGSTLRTDSRLLRKIVSNDTPVYMALDPDATEKEHRIIETLLRYDVEVHKIDVSGYEDVAEMPIEVFKERKKKAAFIDRDNYLLVKMLSAL
jgi:DNA primase